MVLQKQLFTVDDVWRLSHLPENDNRDFYLIKGELHCDMPTGGQHGYLALEIGYHLRKYLEDHALGIGTVETGYYPYHDRHTLLTPDVAFISSAKAPTPFPKQFVPAMPDLAVEVLSPTDSLKETRRKAETYLSNGTTIVWIVLPDEQGVEVCRADEDAGMSVEFVGRDGRLSGENALPGFTLELKLLFP